MSADKQSAGEKVAMDPNSSQSQAATLNPDQVKAAIAEALAKEKATFEAKLEESERSQAIEREIWKSRTKILDDTINHLKQKTELVSKLPRNSPPRFGGEFDKLKTIIWISQLDLYFKRFTGTENEKIEYAASLLTGHARLWYAKNWEMEGEDLPSWDDFKDILLKTFSMPGEELLHMRQYLNLRQKNSVQELIDEHRKLHIVLPQRLHMPQELDIYNFTLALNLEVQDHVLEKKPKTLEDAYQYAFDFEQTIISNRHLQRKLARERNNMQCYGCGQIGHIIRQCHHHPKGYLVEVTESS